MNIFFKTQARLYKNEVFAPRLSQKTLFAAFFLILFIPLYALPADTLKLKNGQTLEGKVVGQNRTSVRLRLPNGQIKVIPKRSITKIRFGAVPDPKKESERKKREEARKRREQERLEKKRLLLEEERRKQEEARRIERERRTREARQKEQEQKRRLAEERKRKEKEKNRYRPPERNVLAIRPGVGQAIFKPLAPALVENFHQTFGILTSVVGSDNTVTIPLVTLDVKTKSRLQSLGIRYTWNAFFADLQVQTLKQDQLYNYASSDVDRINNLIASQKFGALTDPDPLIEMGSVLLGWTFQESPSTRLSLVLGFRRNLLSFFPQGGIYKQSINFSSLVINLPIDFGYKTKTKGAILGLEWEYDFSKEFSVLVRTSLLQQSGTAAVSTGELRGELTQANTIEYRSNGLLVDMGLQRRGFEALLEGKYSFFPDHSVGLRLVYWELKSNHTIKAVQLYETNSNVNALQLALYTKLADGLASAFLPEHRALEGSITFFYEWRYSFL